MGRNTDVLGRALWRDKETLGRLGLRAGMWMAGGTARCLAEGVVEHQQQKERLKERPISDISSLGVTETAVCGESTRGSRGWLVAPK